MSSRERKKQREEKREEGINCEALAHTVTEPDP